MSTASLVANAYAAAARAASVGDRTRLPGSGAATGAEGAGSFGAMLEASLANTLATGAASEQQAHNLMAGKANLVDVVTAVAETEVAIESLVSIRDKVIQAYQDIMQMPI